MCFIHFGLTEIRSSRCCMVRLRIPTRLSSRLASAGFQSGGNFTNTNSSEMASCLFDWKSFFSNQMALRSFSSLQMHTQAARRRRDIQSASSAGSWYLLDNNIIYRSNVWFSSRLLNTAAVKEILFN